jgi:hypothetical protein
MTPVKSYQPSVCGKVERLFLVFSLAILFLSSCSVFPSGVEKEENLIMPRDTSLSKEEWSKRVQDWKKGQKPIVSKDELIARLRAHRESVANASQEYMLLEEKFVKGKLSDKWTENYETAMTGEKLFFSHECPQWLSVPEIEGSSQRSETVREKEVCGFDGAVVRKRIETGTERRGILQKLEDRDTLYPEYSPLDYAEVLPRPPVVGSALAIGGDILPWLLLDSTFVHEALEKVNGVKCLVVAVGCPGQIRFYFDPARDFAFCRTEVFDFEKNDAGVVTGKRLTYRHDNLDFADMGNGLWLPRKIVLENFANSIHEPEEKVGALFRRRTITARKVEVNKGVPDSKFSEDILPREALITDEISSAFYIYDTNGQIKNGSFSKIRR